MNIMLIAIYVINVVVQFHLDKKTALDNPGQGSKRPSDGAAAE